MGYIRILAITSATFLILACTAGDREPGVKNTTDIFDPSALKVEPSDYDLASALTSIKRHDNGRYYVRVVIPTQSGEGHGDWSWIAYSGIVQPGVNGILNSTTTGGGHLRYDSYANRTAAKECWRYFKKETIGDKSFFRNTKRCDGGDPLTYLDTLVIYKTDNKNETTTAYFFRRERDLQEEATGLGGPVYLQSMRLTGQEENVKIFQSRIEFEKGLDSSGLINASDWLILQQEESVLEQESSREE